MGIGAVLLKPFVLKKKYKFQNKAVFQTGISH